jgi:hypothetical protein
MGRDVPRRHQLLLSSEHRASNPPDLRTRARACVWVGGWVHSRACYVRVCERKAKKPKEKAENRKPAERRDRAGREVQTDASVCASMTGLACVVAHLFGISVQARYVLGCLGVKVNAAARLFVLKVCLFVCLFVSSLPHTWSFPDASASARAWRSAETCAWPRRFDYSAGLSSAPN